MSENKMTISSIFDENYKEPVNAEEAVTLVFSFIPADTTAAIKQLQAGLNQYEGVNIKVDGVFGPLSAAALKQAGFSEPVSKADFDEITSPASAAPASKGTDKAKTDSKAKSDLATPHKMSINPFGVSFKQNSTTEKALVWGLWLILAAILLWGGVVLFGEKEGKQA